MKLDAGNNGYGETACAAVRIPKRGLAGETALTRLPQIHAEGHRPTIKMQSAYAKEG